MIDESTGGGEVAVVPQGSDESTQLITLALQKGADINVVERLVELKLKVKAELARDAFNEAMTQFQSECPVIEKKKAGGKTDSGNIVYWYAPIGEIVSQVKELMGKHGLSYMIQSEIIEGGVKAICIAKHKLGHSEVSEFEVPLGTKTAVMSETQRTAAALTFAKRYAFCNAFGIMTRDEDNEDALQSKQFAQDTLAEARARLKGAQDLQELKAAWVSLPVAAKKNEEIIKLKADRKTELEQKIIELKG